MARSLVSALLVSLMLAGCGSLVQPTAAPYAGAGYDALRAKAPRGGAVKAPKAGSVAAENFKAVDKALFRMGQPSDADLAALVAMGVKTDITLQSDRGNEAPIVAHEKEAAQKAGLKVVHLALPWGVKPPAAMVSKFLAVFSDPANLPAVVHCKHGRDRTGTMVAVYRIAQNKWTNAKAFEEMQSFGFKPKDYPYYAEFVQSYKPAAANKRHTREDEAAEAAELAALERLAAPAFGGWDAE